MAELTNKGNSPAMPIFELMRHTEIAFISEISHGKKKWTNQPNDEYVLGDCCSNASAVLAVAGIIVDAKDDKAIAFYEHFGFILLQG